MTTHMANRALHGWRLNDQPGLGSDRRGAPCRGIGRPTILLTTLAILVTLMGLADNAPASGTEAGATPNEDRIPARVMRQYRVHELAFTAAADYVNPFDPAEVDFTVTFTSPAGQAMTFIGFWDGGRTWKVRFNPIQAGAWTWKSSCAPASDTGLHGQKGALTVEPAAGSLMIHLHGGIPGVASDGRHLTYSDGTPFFYLGDCLWPTPSFKVPFDNTGAGPKGWINPRVKAALPDCASPWAMLLDLRKEQGYTALAGRFVRAMWEGGPDPMAALDNDSPDDLLAWQAWDRGVAMIEERGFLWLTGVHQSVYGDGHRDADIDRLWRVLLARYAAYPLSFYLVQEYNWMGPEKQGTPEVQKFCQRVIKSGDRVHAMDPYRRPMGLHPHMPSLRGWQSEWDRPWLGFLCAESGHGRNGLALPMFRTIRDHPGKKLAVFEVEYYWEGMTIDRAAGPSTAATQRYGAYASIQTGNAGYGWGGIGLYPCDDGTYDLSGVWGPPMTWWEALEKLEGQRQMRHVRTLYERCEWWNLKPNPSAPVGRGEVFVSNLGDHTWYVYWPPERRGNGPVQIKGVRPDANYRAEWYDVRTGMSRIVDEGLTATREGLLALPTPPDRDDWMLILRHHSDGAESVDSTFKTGETP